MRFRLQFWAWGVLLGLFITAGSVHAKDAAEKAKAAFKSGSELFEQEQFSAAAIQFRIAYKHKPTWKLLYNIAQCETGAKRYGPALEAFEKYLVESGDDIPVARREEVRSETARLREMVGSLKVTGPAGTELFVDGMKRGSLPLTGYVPVTSALEHTISGILDGKKMDVFTVKVLTGQVLTVHLEPQGNDGAAAPETASSETASSETAPSYDIDNDVPLSSPAQAPPVDTPASRDEAQPVVAEAPVNTDAAVQRLAKGNDLSRKLKIAGIVSLGVGGAALVASLVTGAVAIKKNSQLEEQCLEGYDGYQCVVANTNANTDLKQQRDALGGLTTGLWIGGGAAIAAGAVLLILSKKKRESSIARFTFQPVVSMQQMGGAATWNF